MNALVLPRTAWSVGGVEAWLADLKAALRRNRSRWVQLATTSPDGRPEVRMVVLRRLEGDGRMAFLTDGRSAKVQSLDRTPIAEVLFWSVKTKEQFRVRGLVAFEAANSPLRAELWSGLKLEHRAPFFGPPPGSALSRQADEIIDKRAATPDSFRVFVLTPEQVDLLAIGRSPQTRRHFHRTEDGWQALDLVP